MEFLTGNIKKFTVDDEINYINLNFLLYILSILFAV